MKKELITLPELEAAARRQGFGSLEEVAQAVMEPTGTISFLGKKPLPEAARHAELLARLDRIDQELSGLRGSPPSGGSRANQ